jgi:hypothetical protein
MEMLTVIDQIAKDPTGSERVHLLRGHRAGRGDIVPTAGASDELLERIKVMEDLVGSKASPDEAGSGDGAAPHAEHVLTADPLLAPRLLLVHRQTQAALE